MPILFAGYIIAYIDRVNVSFAKLQMMGDLKFSDSVYGLGAGIFFLGYFLFEVPSNSSCTRSARASGSAASRHLGHRLRLHRAGAHAVAVLHRAPAARRRRSPASSPA